MLSDSDSSSSEPVPSVPSRADLIRIFERLDEASIHFRGAREDLNNALRVTRDEVGDTMDDAILKMESAMADFGRTLGLDQ